MSTQHDLDPAEGLTRAELKARARRRMMRRRRTTVITLVAILVLGGGGLLAVNTIGGAVGEVLGESGDYEGEGGEEVVVTVLPGSSATQVANQLVEEDVIKSTGPFLDEIERQGATINAGDFTMRRQMSAAAAVEALVDPAASQRLTIPEGFRLDQIQARMIELGMSEEETLKAIEDKTPRDYGLDVDAPSLEGYLYPATYEIKPGITAEAMVQEMVDRTQTEIDDLGIALEEVHEVFTLASLVEIEAPGDEEVRRKVARVFINRIGEESRTNNLLQSDATVHYIHGSRPDASTTAEERASDNPYNTYKHPGLPPGPINSPSRSSVDAAQDPADGDWQYFVAVNPESGETLFAESYDEHLENVEKYREWLRNQED
ncbi:endolytic transglycosylase MltG [Brevibacterium daeguense]|uniref:Endolytic murein transglycosylase n=1 Tax=Brevibacterium daeguense TaxID=909936 RepID=A0ABP8EN19_9MICO|nr:endolytic transglycosylase MltG [Brevibacterium daeguense]